MMLCKNKRFKRLIRCLTVLTTVCALSPAASAAPASAEMLVNACFSCHGTVGNSAGLTLPNLAGTPKQIILDAMQEFKAGDRASSLMGRIAQGYSDADFGVMADFFSAQKPQPHAQQLDAAKVALGATLVEKNCAECHITQGRRASDDPPVLSGQWLGFLQLQMKLYTERARKMPLRMSAKVQNLAPPELDAILSYYASQNPALIK